MDETREVAEIVGGLDLKELIENGADMELKSLPLDESEITKEKECEADIQNYLKLECLHIEESYDGQEPFTVFAEKMENVLPDGKVKKRIIREGYGTQPVESTVVNINYNAYVEYEAQPFDSTYARKKCFSFKIGEGEVIEGLEIAVRSMKLNEKSQFIIDPDLAYRSGSCGRIPPNAVVLFEVELQDAHQATKEVPKEDDTQFENVYPVCKALRVKGNNMVRLQNYQGAIKVYKAAVDKLEDAVLRDYNDQLKSEELIVGLYTNLLVCCSLENIPKRGCIFAQKIYEIAKNETVKVNAKVYFNHAKCVKMLGDFERARRLLSQAQKVEPNNQEIMKEIRALQEAHEQHKQQEKKLAKAFINND